MTSATPARPAPAASPTTSPRDGARPRLVVGLALLDDAAAPTRLLAARRSAPAALRGLWEFPGGKVEQGESPPDALRREIREELGCRVSVGESVIATRHVYPFATVVLTTYWCTLTAGQPALTVHSDLAWLRPEELPQLPWAPADIPAVEMIASAATPGTR